MNYMDYNRPLIFQKLCAELQKMCNLAKSVLHYFHKKNQDPICTKKFQIDL